MRPLIDRCIPGFLVGLLLFTIADAALHGGRLS